MELKDKISKTRKEKKLSSGNKNPMSYKSIMKRYKCSLDEAKIIRHDIFFKNTKNIIGDVNAKD